MKILVIGLYYSNNLGDAVICDCVAFLLKRQFPEAEIEICDFLDRTDFARPKEVPLKSQIKQGERIRLRLAASRFTPFDKEFSHEKKALRRAEEHIRQWCQRDYDLVVFGGGEIYMDFLALYVEAFVRGFAEKGTPVIFNAGGVGPSASRKIRQHLSQALMAEHVKWISCRDDSDFVEKVLLCHRKKAVTTYDPALWCREAYCMKPTEFKPDAMEGTSGPVGLGVMYAYNLPFHAVTQFWIRLIEEMDRRKIHWKIFVNGSGSDVSYARYVFSRLPDSNRSFEECCAEIPRKPDELVRVVAGFRSLISFRLHSHIIAAALGIPSVAVVWDNKLRFFFRRIGHEERCCSFHTRAEAVLDKLKNAEVEGVDASLIDLQKKEAERLLIGAVRKEI